VLLAVERTSVRIAAAEGSKADQCLLMIFMDCIGSFRIEVDLFVADEMNQNPFCSRQGKNLRPDHWWINNVVTIFSLAAGTNATLRTLI
jgi:hypothetical protein